MEIKPGTIVIKDHKILTGLMECRISPLLIQIISHIAKKYGIVITESSREKRHMNDLHGFLPLRAIDIRSWCYDYPERIEKEINQIWKYDTKRPNKKVALLHKVRGGAMHFHIQVHQNTRRVSV